MHRPSRRESITYCLDDPLYPLPSSYCGFEGGAYGWVRSYGEGAYGWVRAYGEGAYGPGAYCEGGADAYGGGADGGNGSGSPVTCRQRQQPVKTTEPTAKAMPTMIRITEEPLGGVL